MIASPNDVASERNIVREVIYEWNAVNARTRNVVLLPVGWETHSSPEMGDRPQELINKQVLDKCDLLVGVFWTRIGTATGKYISGTVEEIEKHINAGKPTMLYFPGQPVHPDSVDSEQYKNLKEFNSSCQNRGLFETYDSHSDFKVKFYRHLQIKINEHPLFVGNGGNANIDLSTIHQSQIKIPPLSQEARIMLKEASVDSHGIILLVRTLGGTFIQTNGRNLISQQEPRLVAKWEASLKELVRSDLVIERGHKGEMFEVSNLGYQIADMIEL